MIDKFVMVAVFFSLILSIGAVGITQMAAGTIVPGQQKRVDSGRLDADGNGIPNTGSTLLENTYRFIFTMLMVIGIGI